MKKNNLKPEKMITLAGIAVLVIIVLSLVLNYFKIISLQELFYSVSMKPSLTTSGLNLGGNARKVIAKAGSEEIYQADFDIEKAAYPNIAAQDIDKIIMQKLIKDSIVLQAAQSERWIKLDNSVFNSVQKDYGRRLQLIKATENIYANKQNLISGNVISIWFHNMVPAEIGYERGKEIAFKKINALQADVKSKKISIQQALQAIIDDKSLARVDKSYKSNAILNFRANDGEKITFDSNFDTIIRGLRVGGVSDVYLAQDRSSLGNELVDAVYMFAQVDEINKGMKSGSFDEWYSQKAKNYETIYY